MHLNENASPTLPYLYPFLVGRTRRGDIDLPLERDPVTYVDRTSSMMSSYWNRFKAKCETLDGKELSDYKLATYREIQFWIRDSFDISFHQFLNRDLLNYVKEGRKNGPELREHMKDLTRFILIDNIRREFGNEYGTLRDVHFAKPRDLKDELYAEPETKSEGKEWEKRKRGRPSYKTLLRYMNEYYPELIAKPITFSRKVSDDRRTPYETPLSSDEADAVHRDVAEMMEWASFGLEPFHVLARDMITHQAKQIQIVEPSDIMKFQAYARDAREITLDVIQDLSEDLPETDKIREYWLVKSMLTGRIIVNALFEELRWLTQLRWFRERSAERQWAILSQKCELIYTHADAEMAVRALRRWHSNDGFVFGEIVRVVGSFNLHERIDAGIMLLEECLKQMTLVDDDTGLLHHNLAMQFRLCQDVQKMKYHLERSASFYAKGGYPGAEAIEYGYLAEISSDKEESETYKQKAEDLMASLADKKELAYYYLHLADCADGYGDIAWEKRLLEKALRVIDDGPDASEYYLYMSQCLTDISIMNKRGPSNGFGRVSHPPEWKVGSVSPFFSEAKSSAPLKHKE